MKNIVIFDLDGTILDTLTDMKDSVNYVLSKNGFKEKSTEEIKSYVGNGIELLMRRALPANIEEEDFLKLFADFQEHYQTNIQNKTQPYPGILEVLKILKDNNLLIAVVSNKYQAGVDELVESFFKDYIDLAVGTGVKIKPKPAIDSINYVKNYFEYKEGDGIIFIGDSEVDIQTARNAEIKIASVTWGFRSKEQLTNNNPDYIVDEPVEILEILNISTNFN